ncbi:hypothetical protein ACFP9V_19110 [Deinococcus radiopugnans]|uniref:Uncharacterized protein n=1 Tax=Deinococcus radiopugnans ATCC 19172 TaxID=585398 RepID=A0A5C4Y7R8_9DEIO|nr:hypothetical protein [Deinococcus radiopugnans]MBB6016814.1 hypothetical protein [Deinococcus radiopugnans ATCC 19172]TNM71897.1 hypothetical protein FHR04_05890 [Deinococcus radiopugnans ATCC 19172]
MGFLDKLKLKDWLSAKNAPTRKAVLYTVDDATGEAVPVAAGQLGGGGTASTVTATYPPEALAVGAADASLTVPDGANRALITVTVGTARLGLGSPASAPVYAVGEGVGISGAQLAALRLVREGPADATVRVDYWREA